MIVNRYAKKCQSCNKRVGAGDGFAYQDSGKWLTSCNSSACMKKLGLEAPKAQSTERSIDDSGMITMPFDRGAIDLVKTLTGAQYHPQNKQWSVSIKPKDLLRVVEISDKIGLEISDYLRMKSTLGTSESRAARERAASKHSGKELFPYQKTGVEFLAIRSRALLADDMGLGKAQPITEPVLTPSGWVEIGSLKIGDSVIGSNGKATKVTGVFPQGRIDTFIVKFSDSSSTRCSGEHLWAVKTPNDRVRNGSNRIKTLNELNSQGLFDKNNNSKFFIPTVSPIEMSEKEFEIHPYLLGALLANGCFSNSISHSGDAEQRAAMLPFLPEGLNFVNMGPKCDYRITHGLYGKKNELVSIIHNLGLAKTKSSEKYIPSEYMLGSIEQRLSMLQGLVDNDGTVSRDGMVVEYNTTSSVLAAQVVELVRSLGGIALASTRIPKHTYKGEAKEGLQDNRIRIKLPCGLCPVTIPRKKTLFKEPTKYKVAKSFSSIEKIQDEECVCISVEAEDKLYVTKDYIVTHNTVQGLIALEEGARCIIECPASVKLNWKKEVAIWRPEFDVHICNGRNSFVLPEKNQIVILNFDILPDFLNPEKQIGITRGGKPIMGAELTDEQKEVLGETTLIVDECQLVKNYKTKRAKRQKELSKVCKNVWFLTGTPVDNKPQDLYGIFEAGDMGDVFGSWHKFVDLFNGFKNTFGGYEFGDPKPEVPERLKRTMIRRLKTDVLPDLPPKTYQDLVVDSISKKLKKTLDAFVVRQAVLQGVISDEKEAKKAKAEDYFDKVDMSQLPDFKEFSKIRAEIAESRIPAMLEIVESYEDSDTPLLVFCAHKKPVEELAKRNGWELITGDTSTKRRFEIVDEFQAGKLKGVALTIKAGGVGLTLTHASNALFIDLDWRPTWNVQAEDRLCIEEGQLVAVKGKGYIPIEEVSVGDNVFTHLGRWRKVLNTHSKQNRGLRTVIKYKRFSETLNSTHNHKHLVLKKNDSEPKWLAAHLILPGDFLVTPRKIIGKGFKEFVFPESLRHNPTQENQFGIKHNNGRYTPLPSIIKINTESLFAFGYYVANGFSSTASGKGRFVSWASHVKNRHCLERISKWLKSLGVKSSIYDKKDSLGIELRGYSIELSYLFKDLFGRTAVKKHFPDDWIDRLDKEQLKELFSGYLDGDGYFRKSQYSWVTISSQLSMQLNIISASLGNSPSLTIDKSYKSPNASCCWKGGHTKNGKPSNIALSKSDSKYSYNPVSSVLTEFSKKGNKNIRVYDLEVEEDESFLVGNAIVHNCRIGQVSEKVLIMRMLSSHPLDIHVHKLIEQKMDMMYKTLEKSLDYNAPTKKASTVKIVQETDEELEYRINNAEALAEREWALGRIEDIVERESAKVNDTPLPKLTKAKKATLREALGYMSSQCDGAVEKDGVGFNRPDAAIAKWMSASGMEEGDEIAFRALERILVRYRRQLKNQFAEIWD